MPRANRYFVPGQIYHLTHRCHDRSFLLKFAWDRTAYRRKLWEGLRQFEVALLSYCLTSNHVHLLIYSQTEEQISLLMQKVAGEFAQAYNRRKNRRGAFWEDRYHATMVDSGRYLFACLLYIALNMVRCGVVRHPREWAWSGYDELMGLRQRYRLVNVEKLLWLLGTDDAVSFRKNLEIALEEAIEKDQMARDPRWTESIAVGSKEFVGKIEARIHGRQELEVSEERGVWVLKDSTMA